MSKKPLNKRVIMEDTAKKFPSKLFIGIVSFAVFSLVLTGIIIFLIMGKESYNQVVTPANIEEVISKVKKEEMTTVGSYEVLMNTTWDFKSSKEASYDAVVGNSVYNKNTVYFTIKLADTNQEIYKSPYLKVGSDLKHIKLKENLKKGTYDCVMTYHLVDSDFKEISTVSVTMSIIIHN